jgi:hypothetical protein
MKYFQLSCFLLLFILNECLCQFDAKITGVDFRTENNKIIITYDISDYLPDQVFNITLKFISDDSKTIIPKAVYGDIGTGITGGIKKTIVWDAARDISDFRGMMKAMVSVVIPAAKEQAAQSGFAGKQDKQFRGKPDLAVLSAVFPGLGGYFVDRNKTRSIIYNATAAGIIGYMIHLGNLRKSYEKDRETATPAEIAEIDDKIDKTEKGFGIAGAVYAGVWLTDMIYVLPKSIKMKKARLQGYSPYSEFILDIDDAGNGFIAGCRLNF